MYERYDMGIALNIEGKTYGYLTALQSTSKRKGRSIVWKCRCKCGKVSFVSISALNSGTTRSCGCYRTEELIKRSTKHGASKSIYKEGNKRLDYCIWVGIKERCYSKNHQAYKNYGGRGIKVFKKWKDDFTEFAKYIRTLDKCPSNKILQSRKSGRRLKVSLDRINNNKGYKPGNLKWSTAKEQSNNKRNNIIIKYKNSNYTLTELCEMHSVVNYKVLHDRLFRYKWPLVKALKTPKGLQCRK